MKINTISNITQIDIRTFPLGTVWLFDIDETLLKNNDKSNIIYECTDPELPNWIKLIMARKEPIACITARHIPMKKIKFMKSKFFDIYRYHNLQMIAIRDMLIYL